jgi:hypothetical protein
MKTRTSIKSGGTQMNYNVSMKVRSNVKAGTKSVNPPLTYSVKDVSL